MPASIRSRTILPTLVALALLGPSLAAAQGVESPRVPLRTAVSEINAFRALYADNFNKKDVPALTAMYAPDAVLVDADGSMSAGQAAIGDALSGQSANWTQTAFASERLRVYGNTAWEVGTLTGADGKSAQRYLVVLRRDMHGWKISSVAAVAQSPAASGQ